MPLKIISFEFLPIPSRYTGAMPEAAADILRPWKRKANVEENRAERECFCLNCAYVRKRENKTKHTI